MSPAKVRHSFEKSETNEPTVTSRFSPSKRHLRQWTCNKQIFRNAACLSQFHNSTNGLLRWHYSKVVRLVQFRSAIRQLILATWPPLHDYLAFNIKRHVWHSNCSRHPHPESWLLHFSAEERPAAPSLSFSCSCATASIFTEPKTSGGPPKRKGGIFQGSA